MFKIEVISDNYRSIVDNQIKESWAGPYVAARNVLHDTRTQSGFVAVEDGKIIGYALYNIVNDECEITVLESLHEQRGIGRALINAVMETAKKSGCRRLWLITTNDNTQALRFYQKFGFSLRAVYINAMEESRKLKPQIPLIGCDGIPIAHEFEFEIMLQKRIS